MKNYLEMTGQTEDGVRITTNAETSGRYHTDWLNMMYPRIKLARNLLKEDGFIFLSIDDNEVNNLKLMCDDIFGQENFVANVIWQKKYSTKADSKNFSESHEEDAKIACGTAHFSALKEEQSNAAKYVRATDLTEIMGSL